MNISDFKLEVYFGKHEFSAPYLLAQSDCEAMSLEELLAFEPEGKESFLRTWLGYTETPGSPELRSEVAALYSGLDKENILMHAGAQEAVFAFMNVALERGDHVITMFPTYQSLYEVARARGCALSMWELKQAEEGGWELDIDELEALIRPKTRLIVVNTPNNPTGYTLSGPELRRLCALADKHGIMIFADEVYKGLDLDGMEKPWLADLYERAISMGVLSKAYGLAGLRIGWVATKDKELLEKMNRFKHYLSICNSAPSEALALVALRHGSEILGRNLAIIRENLKTADAFFDRYEGLFLNNRPACGPIAFHRMNLPPSFSMDIFCESLVQKAGVLLLPASVYDYDQPYFRMGYGRKNFAANLLKLDEYLDNIGLA